MILILVVSSIMTLLDALKIGMKVISKELLESDTWLDQKFTLTTSRELAQVQVEFRSDSVMERQKKWYRLIMLKQEFGSNLTRNMLTRILDSVVQ